MIDKSPALVPPYRRVGLAVALFTLLALVMTWPMPMHMADSVIGWMGDNFYFIWLIGWVQRSLFVLHQSPLSVPFLNYPEGWNLAYTEMSPTMVLTALPFALLGGPVLGYNITLLLSFVLSGLGVYLWVRQLSGNGTAALVAGVIFAFCPYRLNHLLGHLQLMGTQWLPFYFMSLSSVIEAPQPRLKDTALSATFLGLIALTSQYYLYMTLMITVIYVGCRWLFSGPGSLRRRETWKGLGLFAVISLPLVVLSVLPYLKLARKQELSVRSLEAVRQWSASPTDFLLPSPRQFIWGPGIGRELHGTSWVESNLYLGIVACVLAGAALLLHGGGRLENDRVKALGLTGLGAFVLALGTDLHWMGRSVIVPVPDMLQRWSPFHESVIPLPGYLCFRYLPFYDGMRVWMRYGIFVSLFVSLLAGLGCAWLLRRLSRRAEMLVGLLVVVLVLMDVFPGAQPLARVSARAVDRWLAVQTGPGSVAQFPAWEMARPEQVHYTSIHGKPFVGAPFLACAPAQFRRSYGAMDSFPSGRSMSVLRELGVRRIVVDAAQYRDFGEVARGIEALGLHAAGVFEGEHVYEVR